MHSIVSLVIILSGLVIMIFNWKMIQLNSQIKAPICDPSFRQCIIMTLLGYRTHQVDSACSRNPQSQNWGDLDSGMMWWYSLRSHQTPTCWSPVPPCPFAALYSSACTWNNTSIHQRFMALSWLHWTVCNMHSGLFRSIIHENRNCPQNYYEICKVFLTFVWALLSYVCFILLCSF